MKKLITFLILSIIAICSYSQLVGSSNDVFNELYNWDVQRVDAWEYDKIPLRYDINFEDMIFPLKKTG